MNLSKTLKRRIAIFAIILLAATAPGSRMKQLASLHDALHHEIERGDFFTALIFTVSNFTGTLFFLAVAGYLLTLIKGINIISGKIDYDENRAGSDIQRLSVFLFLFGAMVFKFFPNLEFTIYFLPAMIGFFMFAPQTAFFILEKFRRYDILITSSGMKTNSGFLKFLNSLYPAVFFKYTIKRLPAIAIIIFALEMFTENNIGFGSMIRLRTEEWMFPNALVYVLSAFVVFMLFYSSMKKLTKVIPLDNNAMEA